MPTMPLATIISISRRPQRRDSCKQYSGRPHRSHSGYRLGFVVAAARKVVPAHKFTEAGKFKGWHPTEFLGQDFWGSTLGIVGAGRIRPGHGAEGLGFGMNIIYYSRTAKPEFEQECRARRVDLSYAAAESDFISLHLPLTPKPPVSGAGAPGAIKAHGNPGQYGPRSHN